MNLVSTVGVEAILGGIGFFCCLVRFGLRAQLTVHELVVVSEIGNEDFNMDSKVVSDLW